MPAWGGGGVLVVGSLACGRKGLAPGAKTMGGGGVGRVAVGRSRRVGQTGEQGWYARKSFHTRSPGNGRDGGGPADSEKTGNQMASTAKQALGETQGVFGTPGTVGPKFLGVPEKATLCVAFSQWKNNQLPLSVGEKGGKGDKWFLKFQNLERCGLICPLVVKP